MGENYGIDARQASGCVTRRAHLSIGLSLFLPLSVCASLLCAIGNTDRSLRFSLTCLPDAGTPTPVISTIFTRRWNHNYFCIQLATDHKPQIELPFHFRLIVQSSPIPGTRSTATRSVGDQSRQSGMHVGFTIRSPLYSSSTASSTQSTTE